MRLGQSVGRGSSATYGRSVSNPSGPSLGTSGVDTEKISNCER